MRSETYLNDVRALIQQDFEAALATLDASIDLAWEQTHAVAQQLRAPDLGELEALRIVLRVREHWRAVDASMKWVIDSRLVLADAKETPAPAETWPSLPKPEAEGPN